MILFKGKQLKKTLKTTTFKTLHASNMLKFTTKVNNYLREQNFEALQTKMKQQSETG